MDCPVSARSIQSCPLLLSWSDVRHSVGFSLSWGMSLGLSGKPKLIEFVSTMELVSRWCGVVFVCRGQVNRCCGQPARSAQNRKCTTIQSGLTRKLILTPFVSICKLELVLGESTDTAWAGDYVKVRNKSSDNG